MGVIRIEDDDGIRVVQMTDEAGGNALDSAMVEALQAAVRDLAEARVVVLRGGPSVFCRGASPAVLAALHDGDIRPTELTLPRALLAVEVPMIAAMEGHAIGGGLALGLCADIVLLARESRYGTTFMELGFTPGMGTTRLLEKVMSTAQAHELLLAGEPKRGAELSGHGFNAVLPRSDVWPHALELARRLADKPRRALCMLKAALADPWRAAFEAAHDDEARMHAVCFARRHEEDAHAR